MTFASECSVTRWDEVFLRASVDAELDFLTNVDAEQRGRSATTDIC